MQTIIRKTLPTVTRATTVLKDELINSITSNILIYYRKQLTSWSWEIISPDDFFGHRMFTRVKDNTDGIAAATVKFHKVDTEVGEETKLWRKINERRVSSALQFNSDRKNRDEMRGYLASRPNRATTSRKNRETREDDRMTFVTTAVQRMATKWWSFDWF